MNNDQRITQLEQQVRDLLTWKEEKMRQQISYPLDIQSVNIIAKYFPRIIKDLVLYAGGASGRGFEYLFLQQDIPSIGGGPQKFKINQDQSQIYSVDPSTDIFTVQNHSYLNNDQVTLVTSDTPPSPLASGTTYFVVSASGLTFKLSATSGGSAINITDVGIGLQFIDYAL